MSYFILKKNAELIFKWFLKLITFIFIFSLSLIWHVLYHSLLVGFNWTGFLRALINLYTMGKNSSVNKGKASSTNYLQHGRTLCQRNPSFEIYFPVKAWLINMLISHVHIQSMCHIIQIWMHRCHVDEIYNPFFFLIKSLFRNVFMLLCGCCSVCLSFLPSQQMGEDFLRTMRF